MISYKQAQQILKQSLIAIGDEYIHSSHSVGRVASTDIKSTTSYPRENNAAFDGYAICSKDTKNINNKNPKKFKIIGSVIPGNKPIHKKVKAWSAIEIMTGGIIPKPFDTIIPVEQIEFYPSKQEAKYIVINKKIAKHLFVRFAGSDYKKNDVVVSKGSIIQPNHLLALKTLVIKKIKVKKKPNILFFSTGNEISNNENIPSYKVRNSNNNYIQSLSANFLFHFINGGILKDNHEKVFHKKIKTMISSNIDMIITSGAVSAGKFDFVPKVIKTFSLSKFFNSVAIRPGKPILFAKINKKQKTIFGLPGNPIAAAACFRFFVHPYLMNILGVREEKPIKAKLQQSYSKKKDATRFAKCKLTSRPNGTLTVEVLQGQESFKIKSLVSSNIWALFPSGKSQFKKGEIIDCYFPNYSNASLL